MEGGTPFEGEMEEKRIVEDLEALGFVILSLPPQLREHLRRLYLLSEKLFASPLDQKRQFTPPGSYLDMDRNRTSGNISDVGYGIARLKERFRVRLCKTDNDDFGINWPSIEYSCDISENEEETEQNKVYTFRDECLATFKSLYDISKQIIYALAKKNDVSEVTIRSAMLDDPMEEMQEGYITSSILDLFYYYNNNKTDNSDMSNSVNLSENRNLNSSTSDNALGPLSSDSSVTMNTEQPNITYDTNQKRMNIGAHSDSGLLTIIPFSNVSGLEIFDIKQKRWLAVENSNYGNHLEHMLVFAGDALTRLSNGLYPKLLHRVTMNDKPRFSITFKLIPSPLVIGPFFPRAQH
jgi:isopenicillin N synthase-like dioxygenase